MASERDEDQAAYLQLNIISAVMAKQYNTELGVLQALLPEQREDMMLISTGATLITCGPQLEDWTLYGQSSARLQ